MTDEHQPDARGGPDEKGEPQSAPQGGDKRRRFIGLAREHREDRGCDSHTEDTQRELVELLGQVEDSIGFCVQWVVPPRRREWEPDGKHRDQHVHE